MRVVHYCKTFSSLSETFIYDYISEQKRQGIDAHVMAHHRVNWKERPFDDITIIPWPGMFNVQRLRYRALEFVGARARKTSSWPLLRAGMKEVLRDIPPDVVHAHFGPSGVRIAPVAQALDIPTVVTFYGYDISKLARQSRWRQRYRTLWPRVQAVTALSEEMKEAIEKLGCPGSKIRVVHLSRDLQNFAYRPPQPPIRELVSVGRLTEKKGHMDAIRAVHRLVQEGRDLHLRIIGGGTLHVQLDRYIQDNNLQDYVKLMGAQPNEKVAEYLRGADAFILCSKTAPSGDREGTPTVLIEAQAVGLPCISTRHSGIPEMIPAVNHHLLAEAGSVESIVSCLKKLLACSPQEVCEIAKAGREKVERAFDLTGEVEKLRALYQQVQ